MFNCSTCGKGHTGSVQTECVGNVCHRYFICSKCGKKNYV